MPKPRAPTLLRLLLAVLLLAGAWIWLGRDLPRWAVERFLAGASGARVELGELASLGPRRLVLRRLRIAEIPDLPIVGELTVEELRAEAVSAREMLAGRFQRVEIRGLAARLVPAAFELRDEPLPVAIDELELAPAEISVATPEGETRLVVEGIAHRIGGGATAELAFGSPRLELAPLLRLVSPATAPRLRGRLNDLAGDLGLDGAALELAAGAGAASLETEDLRLELESPQLEASTAGELRTLAVSSPAIRARSADPPDGDRVAELGAGRLAAVLQPAAERPGTLHFELTPELAVFAGARIAGDWHPAAGRLLSLEANVEGLRLEPLLAGRAIEGDADVELKGEGERLRYRVVLRPTRFRAAGLETPGTTLAVSGETAWPDLGELAEPGGFDLPAALAGTFEASLDVPAAAGSWRSFEVPAAALPLAAHLSGELVADHRGTSDHKTPGRRTGNALRGSAWLASAAAGRLAAEGELTFGAGGAAAELMWRWRGARLPLLLPLLDPLGLPAGDLNRLGLAGDLAADGHLGGPLSGPTVAATVEVRRLAASGTPDRREEAWSLRGGEVRCDLAAGPGGLELRSLAASGELTTPPLGPIPLTATASGRGDLALAAGRLTAATLESPGLGRLRLSGDWRPAPGGRTAARGRIVAEEVDVAAWQETLGPILPGPRSGVPDLALGGRIAAELEAELRGTGGWQLAGPLCLRDGGFASTYGARVMEGLAATAELRVDGAPGSPVAAHARGHAGGFLLLWDAFFGDFSRVEAGFEMTGTLVGDGDGAAADPVDGGDAGPSLELRAALEVPRGPRLAATLERPAGGEPSYRLKLDDEDLAATHELYLRQVLSQSFGEAELDGAVSARLGGHRAVDGTWTVGGDVRAIDLGWTSTSGEIAVDGLDLILPLDLRLPGDGPQVLGGEPPASRRRSRLRFDRLALSGLELPPTDSGLWVEGDAVSIDEPIDLSILGGTVTLEQLTLRRLLTPGRHLESRLQLSGLSLEEISRAIGIFPLEGTLDGTFPRVRISGSELKVEGGGEIALFGGSVRVSDISGEEIFTRFPKLTLSADFENIDLGRLTRRIDFGEMTGVLQGRIANCQLFRGIPVRCRARFETVRREGVAQTIDVKAINNLTILGTGAATSVLDRGILRFFKRKAYAGLGVDVSLDRDVLLLRGLERRGDKELFLRGRLPFPIDVVNVQPGRTVSFQTMLRRLQSLEGGGATTSPPGG